MGTLRKSVIIIDETKFNIHDLLGATVLIGRVLVMVWGGFSCGQKELAFLRGKQLRGKFEYKRPETIS